MDGVELDEVKDKAKSWCLHMVERVQHQESLERNSFSLAIAMF